MNAIPKAFQLQTGDILYAVKALDDWNVDAPFVRGSSHVHAEISHLRLSLDVHVFLIDVKTLLPMLDKTCS